MGVADSGSGLSDELVALINGCPDDDLQTPRDELSQTGLGLSLVRGLVTARGGRLVAGRSPEGGALMLMSVRSGHPDRVRRRAPSADPDRRPDVGRRPASSLERRHRPAEAAGRRPYLSTAHDRPVTAR